ncbi:MAG: Hpt domain-containing protein [Planctomycetes bacterium]|jgi:HPt (histidine-containing phosphotransfer) domain-containing protein|nr:Hpt domain-containing protein [Planctomycetota bacterium]
MTGTPAAIDYDEALDRMDGDRDLLREMAELVLEDIPYQLTTMQQAMDADDSEALAKSAHSLKGAVANLAARSTQQAASDLEQAARVGDMDRVAAGLRVLQQQLDSLVPELRRICSD